MMSLMISLIIGAGSVTYGSGFSHFMTRAEKWCGEHPQFCLREILQYKCWEYTDFQFLPSRKEFQCDSAVNALIRITDLSPETDQQSTAIFSQTLPKLLTAFRIQSYLLELTRETAKTLRNQQRFSLWDFTLKSMNGNRMQALQTLATLFQDNTAEKPYLKPYSQNGIHAAYEFYDFEKLQTSGTPENLFIRVYPNIDSSELHKNFYHFYIAAYVSATLEKKGYSKSLASFVSFLFQAEYEFSEVKGANWPFSAPQSIDAKKYDWKIRDLYQSYLGSVFGTETHKTALSFDQFREKLSKNPANLMKSLF